MNAEPVVMRPRIRRSVSRTIGLAAALALLTSACAAGQLAQTAEQKASIDGTNKSVGPIDLRAVAIEAPPIGTAAYRPRTAAELKLVLVNTSTKQDTLTSITTSAAGGWATFANYSDAFHVQQARAAAVDGTTSPSAAPSSSPSPSSSRRPSKSSSAPLPKSSSALPKGSQLVVLPPGNRVSFGTPEATGAILLLPLTKALYPGSTANITFTFTNAGSVTFAVPVQLATTARTAKVEAPAGLNTEQP